MKAFNMTFVIAVVASLSTGAVLVQHPMPKGLAPGAYSDIVIAQDDKRSQGDMNKGNPPRNP